MKTIAFDGSSAQTTDEIAEALLELAMTASRYGAHELVSIPIRGDARTEHLTLMLGPTARLSARSDANLIDTALDGADETVRRLQDRSRAIADPFGSLQAASDEFFGHPD